jgi:hypothetical protein
MIGRERCEGDGEEGGGETCEGEEEEMDMRAGMRI